MATRFTSVRGRSGAVKAGFDAIERDLLMSLLGEMLSLLEVGANDGEQDELAAMVGIGTSTSLPEDPVLARLFPDGYSGDDEAAADFRRFTEPTLRDRKRTHARTALASLEAMGEPGTLVLDAAQARAWLGALNDLRLALGERLGIDDDVHVLAQGLDEDDPRRYLLAVYDLLTWLQETLVRALR